MNLLQIEWLKIRRYRTFWIITGMFAVLAPLALYVLNIILQHEGQLRILMSAEAAFGVIWHNTAFMISHFIIFLALLILVLGGNEYQYRTHRQNVIDGWSRLQFYHAKWRLILTISLAVLVFAFLTGLFSAMIQGAPLSAFSNDIISLLWLLLQTVNYLGLALMLITLLRRSGLAIIIFIAYYMIVDNIAHAILVIRYKLPVADLFLPMESSDQLLPRPYGLNVAFYERLPNYAFVAGTLAWIAIAYFVGRQKTLRSDW